MKDGLDRVVRELVKSNKRMEAFVREQREINHRQETFNRIFARGLQETNRRMEANERRMEAFMIQSERRFKLFYHLVTQRR